MPERLPARDVGNETVFEFPFTTEFPFGIKSYLPADAYDEISKKLFALNFPTLFLSSLQEVKFSFGSTTWLYKKEIQSARTFGKTTAELLKLTGSKAGEQNLWLFTRKFDGKNYSVGYFPENGRLKPINETAFLLNDSREQSDCTNFINGFPRQPRGLRSQRPARSFWTRILKQSPPSTARASRNFSCRTATATPRLTTSKDEIQSKIRTLYARLGKIRQALTRRAVLKNFRLLQGVFRLGSWRVYRRLKAEDLLSQAQRRICSPKKLYMPETERIKYFRAGGSSPIINKDFYLSLVEAELLHKFFEDLGVAKIGSQIQRLQNGVFSFRNK